MKKSGWCQNCHSTQKRAADLAPTCVCFLSHLTPPHPMGHSGCTPQRCQRSNIEDSSYVRQHSPSCERARCVEVIAEDSPAIAKRQRRISSLLDLGHTPVVNLHFSKEGPIIQINASTSVPRYVAISHVWWLSGLIRNVVHWIDFTVMTTLFYS